jgi:DNA-binding winged helix-turn-helix (wHTH) protein/Tol biopolymer transport system component
MAAAHSQDLHPTPHSRRYSFGPFHVDVQARRTLRGTDVIVLPSRAFDTLVYLIEHRERLVDKEELLRAVWRDLVVTDDSLIHAISVLRRSLVDDAHGPLIETIPRRGYRFVQTVEIANDASAAPSPAASSTAPRRARRSRLRFWPIGVAVVAMASAAVVFVRAPTPAVSDHDHTIRLFQPPPPGTEIVSGGLLSPDGQHLVFVARDTASGKTALWLRRLQSSESRQLPATDGASKPFWAPDSRRIAFFAAAGIKVVELSTETTRLIAGTDIAPAGGTWGPDDTIVFADWSTGLFAVHASGQGGVRQLRSLDRSAQEISYTWPQFLPDGRHYLYHAVSLDPAATGIYVTAIDGTPSQLLLSTESPAVFAPPSHLMHVQNGMLIAEEIDLAHRELTGRSLLLARDIAPPSLGDGDIVSAATNLVTFREGARLQNLAWFDRNGAQLESLSVPTVLFNPRVSPDGTALLATSSVTVDPGLWVARFGRDEYVRLETDAIAPLWAPDGERVAFTSRNGLDLSIRSAASGESPPPLLSGGTLKILNDWAPAGDTIVYSQSSVDTKLDLWAITIADGRSTPLLATPYNEVQARFSPDGRWLAYVSDETGALEVYVASYPGLERRYQVSTTGGGQPQWRADRRELFFVSADRELMSVAVSGTDTLTFAAPHALFRPPFNGGPNDARDHYAVSADGSRFLVDGAAATAARAPITVMINWSGAAAAARPLVGKDERLSLAAH